MTKYALVYDTETTGLPSKKSSLSAPNQPHLVQLSALLINVDNQRVEQSLNLIVQPTNWTIPDRVAEIHGITTDHARKWGQPLNGVLNAFLNLWTCEEPPVQCVAHNAQFDRQIIAIEIAREFGEGELLNEWSSISNDFCTMNLAKPIVGATTKTGALKFPKLQETYKHFFSEEFSNAHSANADCVATMQVYFALLEALK